MSPKKQYRQKLRQLKKLMADTAPIICRDQAFGKIPNEPERGIYYLTSENAKMIYKLSDELKLTEPEAISIWREIRTDRRDSFRQSLEKPCRVRKDNKQSINYGSWPDNRNLIRFPKKVRKTAWKRFYKLFPQLKPKS